MSNTTTLPGLTLRDYFAAAALTGLMAHDNSADYDEDAVAAYKSADAMLEEREKWQEPDASVALAAMEKIAESSPEALEARLFERAGEATAVLALLCHGAAARAGWWRTADGADVRDNPMCFAQKLCLIHSEISEAMEGDRKGLPDDKLPHRQMREVELADALIRICDLAGAYGLDLGGAVAEKLAFNASRADHKPEARTAAGGKAY